MGFPQSHGDFLSLTRTLGQFLDNRIPVLLAMPGRIDHRRFADLSRHL